VVGTPADLALIRMQADGTLPLAQRRNYTGVFNALSRIVSEEGFFALWKGCLPTVTRAMSLNMAMLASYDQSKEFFRSKTPKPSFWTVEFPASTISGFLASVASLPFDFVKTRIQKMRPDAEGKLPYSGSVNCALVVLRSEGPFAFYRGFLTYYLRVAPHAMLTLLALDQMTKFAPTIEKSIWK